MWILGGAALCVVGSAALLAVGSTGANVLGYVVASFLTITMIGAYRQVDFRRHLHPDYRPRPGLSRAIPVILVAGLVVTALHTWAIATELAK